MSEITQKICQDFVENNIHNKDGLAVAIVVADSQGCTVHVCSGLPDEAATKLVEEIILARINNIREAINN